MASGLFIVRMSGSAGLFVAQSDLLVQAPATVRGVFTTTMLGAHGLFVSSYRSVAGGVPGRVRLAGKNLLRLRNGRLVIT